MNQSIHLKIEQDQAIESKKTMLLSQKNILSIVQKIRAYNNLKKLESAVKAKIKSDIQELRKQVNEIEAKLPKDVPNVSFKYEERIQEIKSAKIKEPKIRKELSKKSTIEQELEDIQAKLARLQ